MRNSFWERVWRNSENTKGSSNPQTDTKHADLKLTWLIWKKFIIGWLVMVSKRSRLHIKTKCVNYNEAQIRKIIVLAQTFNNNSMINLCQCTSVDFCFWCFSIRTDNYWLIKLPFRTAPLFVGVPFTTHFYICWSMIQLRPRKNG